MKTTPDNEKLLDLVEQARKGKIVLPQFQRNFVWNRDDITALIVSVLQGHYIGSFLFLDSDPENIPFAYRALQGIDLAENHLHPETMILDGQQRLTSLNYAISAPDIPLRSTRYPYRFFISLDSVVNGDIEAAVFSERSASCEAMLQESWQFENRKIPMTIIESWNDWLNRYERWLLKKDQDFYLNQYFMVLKPAWSELMQQVQTYLVPTITIPKSHMDRPDSLAEVCAIFEKINSTGVKLSVYDLLTARLYKDHIDLHRLWEAAVSDHHLLNKHSGGTPDEFGVYLLRTIALLRGGDVRSRSLINLSPRGFERDWKTAVTYMEKALERMTSVQEDGFGAFDRKWMPYVTMVTTLAAILHLIDNQRLDHQAYHLMRRWYWSSVFTERYAGAVETAIYRDYQDFVGAVQDARTEPEAIRDARSAILDNPSFGLLSVSRLNSLYRGVMCLVALRGAKDFRADDSIQFHTLEDHHIFPSAYLGGLRESDGSKFAADRINTIVNRTLIADVTNAKISKSRPSQYVRKLVPADRAEAILATHFIGGDCLDALRADNYQLFLKLRERALISEVRRRIAEA